ncbi:MAG: cell wall hydrolase [Sphingomonadales bacterium]|nr:cell wall hydrolase [Sphingomonadales bacterium]MDE2168068.1 cell wall hydrolase [Sphingomonadales bacterium]
MPFETPGDSFPGSAYYYLAQDHAGDGQDTLTPGTHGDGEATSAHTPGGLTDAGPSARALIARGGTDYARALDCLTAAVYYEAASEPDDGQRAVAQVVLNRLAHPSFPKTVCGVVYQGSERATGCQFTFACDGAMLRPRSAYFWDRARQVARAALAGYVFAPVGLATHYHTFAVHPYWDGAMNFIGQIGAHRFFRFPGVAGVPAAFHFAWNGAEPLPGPHPRLATAAVSGSDATDPLALERAYEAGLKQAGGQAAMVQPVAVLSPAPLAYAAPAYTAVVMRQGGDGAYRASGLPEGNTVHSAYQDSGRWIATPQ